MLSYRKMLSNEEIVGPAAAFLAPVLAPDGGGQRSKRSFLERVAESLGIELPDERSRRRAVISRAVVILEGIQEALMIRNDILATQQLLHSSESRRVIDGLLDLIAIEGIYPNLLSGVGVPLDRRTRSVLLGKVMSRPNEDHNDSTVDWDFLGGVICSLEKIALSFDKGLWNALQRRILVDIIAAQIQLSYSPNNRYNVKLGVMADNARAPIEILLRDLIALLHSGTPPWFKAAVTTQLSRIPLRADGVRQVTRYFISNSLATDQSHLQGSSSSMPALSLQVLKHITTAVTAVPSTMGNENYFGVIAPQLIVLLDEDETEMQFVAAYIISHGILSRKAIGSPGTIGWRLIVEPILSTINPPEASSNSLDLAHEKTVISSAKLHHALSQLRALTLLHPNPGLLKRLIKPHYLQLWAAMCNASPDSQPFENSSRLLQSYFMLSAGPEDLYNLVDNFLVDGKGTWTFALDENKQLEIQTNKDSLRPENSLVSLIDKIDYRIRAFVSLLGQVGDDESIINVFSYVHKKWLTQNIDDGMSSILGHDIDEIKAKSLVVYAKLTQGMLETYRNKVAGNPDRIVELLIELLSAYISQQQPILTEPSLYSLGSITKHTKPQTTDTDGIQSGMIEYSLSALFSILSTPDLRVAASTVALFGTLKDILVRLTGPKTPLPTDTKLSASNVLALIDFITIPNTSISSNNSQDQLHSDRRLQVAALRNIESEFAPVRAEGISQYTSLITKSSPVLDIPTAATLFWSLLRDDDEFVYLGAVKALGVLSQKHRSTVTNILTDAYIDRSEESTLNVRLRTGEALKEVIEKQGSAMVGESATKLAMGLVGLAGRRTWRPKAKEEKDKAIKEKARKKQEAEEAWGGEVPEIDIQGTDGDEHEVNERLAKILESWGGKDGEEDLRIRTSAISLLSLMIESSPAGLGSGLITIAIDLTLSILAIERGEEYAILRRGSISILISLLRALDVHDMEGELGFGLSWNGVTEIVSTLKTARSTEEDLIARQTTDTAISGFEEYMRKVISVVRSDGSHNIRFGLEGKLKGLDIDPEASHTKRPLVEEIE